MASILLYKFGDFSGKQVIQRWVQQMPSTDPVRMEGEFLAA
jgi:hypothetical protein